MLSRLPRRVAVLAHEVGLKSTWLDNRLRLNAVAFHSDYDSIQFLVGEEGQDCRRRTGFSWVSLADCPRSGHLPAGRRRKSLHR